MIKTTFRMIVHDKSHLTLSKQQPNNFSHFYYFIVEVIYKTYFATGLLSQFNAFYKMI